MKLNHRYIGLFFLLQLFLGACNKIDVPEPIEEAPVFYTDLRAGDIDLNLSAGRDNYLMEANFRVENNTRILDLIGVLRPADCTARLCPGSVRISLRNSTLFNPGTFDVDELFSKNQFNYAWNVNRDSALVVFMPDISSNDITTISWLFEDGRGKEEHNKKVVEKVLKINQDYRMRLEIRQRSCTSSQTQTINLGSQGCKTNIGIRDRKLGARTPQGQAPFKYQWSNGSSDSTILLSALTAVDMRNNISVTVTDSRGCVSEASIGFTPGMANDSHCTSNFTYSRKFSENQDKLQLGSSVIEVINRDGSIYRSDVFRQPSSSSFQIIEIADFQDNERGQKTKKLKINLNAHLFENSDAAQLLELKGICVIAVAYPD